MPTSTYSRHRWLTNSNHTIHSSTQTKPQKSRLDKIQTSTRSSYEDIRWIQLEINNYERRICYKDSQKAYNKRLLKRVYTMLSPWPSDHSSNFNGHLIPIWPRSYCSLAVGLARKKWWIETVENLDLKFSSKKTWPLY